MDNTVMSQQYVESSTGRQMMFMFMFYSSFAQDFLGVIFVC